ncbi:MAG: hypothetical protein KAG34_03900 [Cocleimonas sp.]|nr:hypothetical protein [Cocleimonas sp.]
MYQEKFKAFENIKTLAGKAWEHAVAIEAALSAEELELQEKRHDFIRMQVGALALAKEQGFDQGIEKGIEKERQRSQIELVVKSYRIGLSVSTISELTGLDDDEIMTLLKAQDDL